MPENTFDTSGPIWTPKIVQTVLVGAARWCVASEGRVKPMQFKNNMPDVFMTGLDRYFEKWAEKPEGDRPRKRLYFSPADISEYERAIWWPVTYLSDDPEFGAAMQLWLQCKAERRQFDDAVDEVGLSRATAYRWRDKGFSLIAQGLTRDRVLSRFVDV